MLEPKSTGSWFTNPSGELSWRRGLQIIMSEVSLDQLSAGRFQELVQTKFEVRVEPGPAVSLELTTVTTPPSGSHESVSPGNQMVESFSLLFNGPADRPLGQRMYRFTHERLGSFDLFIVPVSADRNARQYEAVFNRRRATGKSG